MRHEAGPRREDGEVAAAFLHLLELVRDDGFLQLVIADLQLGHLRHLRRVLDAGNLAIAPFLERLGRGGVVTVNVDDHVSPV
jgi:hypothetical protein